LLRRAQVTVWVTLWPYLQQVASVCDRTMSTRPTSS